MSSSVFTTLLHSSNPNENKSLFSRTAPTSSSNNLSNNKDTTIHLNLPSSSHSNSTSKFQAKRLFKDALTYSQLHYNNDLLTELSTVSLSSYEYINELQTLLKQSKRLQLSELLLDLSMIRSYLTLENEKLQEFIQSLQGIIDKDMQLDDDHHGISSSSIGNNNKQISGKNLPSALSSSSSTLKAQNDLSSGYGSKLHLNKRLPMKNPLERGRSQQKVSDDEETKGGGFFDDDEEIPTKDHSHDAPMLRNNNNKLEAMQQTDNYYQSSTPSKKGSSRFREKIKDAQVELYLVDDL